MMDLLTPLTRRIVALGLLVLVLLSGLSFVVAPLIAANQNTLSELALVREALARARAIQEAPAIPKIAEFPQSAGLKAASMQAARESLAGYAMSRASAKGLQITLPAMPQPRVRAPAPVELAISITGAREALLEWMSDVETGRPACRFLTYRLVDAGPPMGTPSLMPQGAPPPPSGVSPNQARLVRLEATLTTLWMGPQ
jgi:hypothetical protein